MNELEIGIHIPAREQMVQLLKQKSTVRPPTPSLGVATADHFGIRERVGEPVKLGQGRRRFRNLRH